MKFRFLVLTVLFFPTVSHAEVLFSEIAWMGTLEDANNEWIEIYNFSSSPTDINGWTITDGNSLNIQLQGTMPPHGVFVLERTDDTSVPGVTADVIYTGALTNTGATLTIKDNNGQVVGSPLVGGENWENIGGNNVLKYTAQVTRQGVWVTGVPTPGLPNVEEDADIPDDIENTPTPKSTSSGGGGVVKSRTPTQSIKIDQELSLRISGPSIAYINQDIQFSANPSGVGKTTESSLTYLWNFGDTNVAKGKSPTHKYAYPGEYVVAVEAGFAKQEAQARHEIKILPVSFTLEKTTEGDIKVTNKATHEVDLDGFTLQGMITFVFPRMSILKAGGSVIIPKEKIGGSPHMASLYDAHRGLVNTLAPTLERDGLPQAYVPLASAYTRPTANPSVSADTTESTDTTSTAPEEAVPNIIQIGAVAGEQKPSLIARFFKKIGTFFQ